MACDFGDRISWPALVCGLEKPQKKIVSLTSIGFEARVCPSVDETHRQFLTLPRTVKLHMSLFVIRTIMCSKGPTVWCLLAEGFNLLQRCWKFFS